MGEVCEYPKARSFSQFIFCLGIGVCPRILLYIKKMRGAAMVTTLSLHGKYSQCPAFDIKQSPTGRSPEDCQSKSHGEINI